MVTKHVSARSALHKTPPTAPTHWCARSPFAVGEEILPFTNMAAKVLHEAVTYNGGQPNRNLGDAFLCVWKPQARLLATPPYSRL